MNYYELSNWSIQICKNQKEKESKSCIEDPEVSTNKTRTNGSFTALFIRVTVYSLNPLEKLLFMRGVLFLLPQDGSREWWPARGSGRPWSSPAAVKWRGGTLGLRAHAGLPSMARRGLWWRGHSSRGGDGSFTDGGEQQRPTAPV